MTKLSPGRYAQVLTRMQKQAPYIIARTLNDIAFFGRSKAWPDEIKKTMTLRSPWTLRSLRVTRATPKQLTSVLGSVEPYMSTQERGETQGKKGKHGVPIPAGAPAMRKLRKRKVPKRNQLGALNVIRVSGGRSQKQRNAVALSVARKRGGGIVRLTTANGHVGLFRVGKSRRRPTKLWDLSKPAVRIPATRTLDAAIPRIMRQAERIWRKQAFAALKRQALRR